MVNLAWSVRAANLGMAGIAHGKPGTPEIRHVRRFHRRIRRTNWLLLSDSGRRTRGRTFSASLPEVTDPESFDKVDDSVFNDQNENEPGNLNEGEFLWPSQPSSFGPKV